MKAGVACTSEHSNACVSNCRSKSRIRTQRRAIAGMPECYRTAVALANCRTRFSWPYQNGAVNHVHQVRARSHCLFSHISMNRADVPLRTFDTIMQYREGTATRTWLRVKAN